MTYQPHPEPTKEVDYNRMSMAAPAKGTVKEEGERRGPPRNKRKASDV